MDEEDFKGFKSQLSAAYPACLGSQEDHLDVSDVVQKIIESFGECKALTITMQFLDFGKIHLIALKVFLLLIRCNNIHTVRTVLVLFQSTYPLHICTRKVYREKYLD